ncbi:helix-turn-helix domain-containing protein [Aureispira sp. CCB-QB1]|uniref:helix-turn-helix domain-containing protein n=1 Tax=Aureispira sp. CCB-QB1 TaxID=1313421 RepID=UPI0009DCA448|nr:helix-turn-helix domain-containing protein [Aureispira sp. CCB-QB1]
MQNVVFTQLSIPEFRKLLREEVKQVLSEQATSDTHQQQQTILNFEEGCQYIGISKSHGYKLTSQQLIPFSKRGKRIYFEKAALDQWLLSNKVQSVSELEEDMDSYLAKKGGNHGTK